MVSAGYGKEFFKHSSWIELLFLLCLVSAGIFLTMSFYELTYDDVFLAFRYAKNIISGNGFVFNPGESFLGTPAPFYVLLLVAGKWLVPFLSIHQIGGIISGSSLLLLSLFIYAIGRFFDQRLLGALAAVFTLTNPLIVMTLGSETPIFLFLVTAAFYFYFCRGRINIAALLLAISILTRTEGVIPAAIFFGHFIMTRKKFPAGAFILSLLVLSPWLIFAYLNFGSPITSSMGAKIAQRSAGLPPFVEMAAWWMYKIIVNNNLFYVGFAPLLISGSYYFIKKGRNWDILFGWIAGQTAVYLLLDIPFYHWYIAHAGLGLSILAAMGAIALLESFRSRGRIAYRAALVIVALSIILAAAAQVQHLNGYHQPHPANQLYTAAGEWFANNTETGSTIAYIENGQIGYHSDRRIIDVLGLVTPGASDRVKQGNFIWAYLNYQPDYIIYNSIFASWIGVVLQEPWFRENYIEAKRLTEPGYPAPFIIYKKIEGAKLPEPLEVDIVQIKRKRPAGEINGANITGQTFIAGRNNLSGIEIALTTYERQNNKTVIFHLKESSQSDEDIFRKEFPASDVIDKAGYLFHFPAIEDSAGRSFYFYLESSESYQRNAISAWASSSNEYKDGSLYMNNQAVEGRDLTFKTFYSP